MASLAFGNPSTAPKTPARGALKLGMVEDNTLLSGLPSAEPCPPLSPSDDSSKFSFSSASRSSSIDANANNTGIASVDNLFAAAIPTLHAGGVSPPNCSNKKVLLKNQRREFSLQHHRSSTEVYLSASIEGDMAEHVIEDHFRQYSTGSESRSSSAEANNRQPWNLSSDEYNERLTENLFLSGNSIFTFPTPNNLSPPHFKPGTTNPPSNSPPSPQKPRSRTN